MKILNALLIFICFSVCICHAQTDTFPPQFQMLGAPCIQVCQGSSYTDSGFTYYDLPDSFADITIVQEGSFITNGTANTGYYKMRYKGVDKAGNIGYSEWRKIQVVDSGYLPNCQPVAVDCNTMDTIPPIISLVGDPAASVCRWCPYKDSGYIVSDNIDLVMNIRIEIESNFLKDSSKTEGIYTLRYKATDKSGNFSFSDWRFINVRSPYEFPCENSRCHLSVNEKASREKLYIYPNPAQSELFIETNEYVSSVNIYTISGQKLSEININRNLNLPYKIDTKHFPAGVYMVQIKTTQGIIHKKVQISR